MHARACTGMFRVWRVLVTRCHCCGAAEVVDTRDFVLQWPPLRNAEQTRLCIVFVSTDEVCIITVISCFFLWLTNVNTNARNNLVAR